jgi:NAD(P)H-dependent flavin oxidoreductase YrpB (nitropropane dioxygenase family)
MISGRLVDPLVEGGKGVNITNALSSGAWAKCGGVGTFSGTHADLYNEIGKYQPYTYKGVSRKDRHEELITQSIKGGIDQAKLARDTSEGKGAIMMNLLWECGGIPQILEGVLEEAGHLIDGVVCGAGLPFQLAEICAKREMYYNPIVSSELAFRILWQRAFSKYPSWLGSVVYEDPWLAGGHNGISSKEDPQKPEKPYDRVLKLRRFMNSVHLNDVTLIIAGGVWNLAEWSAIIDCQELHPIAFQFGTRLLLTQESPISNEWKMKLFNVPEGQVKLHKFSPTGFYSSAINNAFLQELYSQVEREIPFRSLPEGDFVKEFKFGRRIVYVKSEDDEKIAKWAEKGYTDAMKTPDITLIFVKPERRKQILQDQIDCIGCLNRCKFSNWDQHNENTGVLPDPRSFCISKTLVDVGHGGSIEDNLLFSGHNVYRFALDPFYKNNHIPTVAEVYARIKEEYENS